MSDRQARFLVIEATNDGGLIAEEHDELPDFFRDAATLGGVVVQEWALTCVAGDYLGGNVPISAGPWAAWEDGIVVVCLTPDASEHDGE